MDPDGRWDVAFGDILFGKYDIFTPTKQVNTGNKFADFWLVGICGISNLCAVPFNYAANVLGLVDEGITWLDERWPSEWTCTGISIRAKLPEYNSQTKHLWDEASRNFAQQATGDVTVLIGPYVSGTSTFNRIELEALQQNPNVNSIKFILME